MAAEPSNTIAGAESDSAAQKLLAKHAADEAHNPTIEEVPDEEDLAHPPPSTDGPTTMSDVAKGKQKAQDAPIAKPKGPAFDVTSNDAFPALGGPKAQPVTASSWGKKPANGTTNGASNGAPRAPPPGTPASGPRQIAIPGRFSEEYKLGGKDLTPRAQLKKPVTEIIREVNMRSKATVTLRAGLQGGIVLRGEGPSQDGVQAALKEVIKQISANVRIHEH